MSKAETFYRWACKFLNKKTTMWLMTMSNDAIKELLVDKKEIALKLATKFKGFLGIEISQHFPVLPFPISDISLRERILLELGVRYLVYAGDLQNDPALPREILISRTKGSDSGIRGTLSKLRAAGLVETSDNGDQITIEGLLKLRTILSQHRQEHQRKEGLS